MAATVVAHPTEAAPDTTAPHNPAVGGQPTQRCRCGPAAAVPPQRAGPSPYPPPQTLPQLTSVAPAGLQAGHHARRRTDRRWRRHALRRRVGPQAGFDALDTISGWRHALVLWQLPHKGGRRRGRDCDSGRAGGVGRVPVLVAKQFAQQQGRVVVEQTLGLGRLSMHGSGRQGQHGEGGASRHCGLRRVGLGGRRWTAGSTASREPKLDPKWAGVQPPLLPNSGSRRWPPADARIARNCARHCV